jgi:hypothetical protein
LRKSLPATDGGALVLRDAWHEPIHLADPSPATIARRAASLTKKWLLSLLCVGPTYETENQFEPAASRPDIPKSYYCQPNQTVFGISRLAIGLLNRTDPGEIVRRRRENFMHLRSSLAEVADVDCLWMEDQLPDGMSPLGLPLLVKDRSHWYLGLNAAGIYVSRWWEGYHRGLDWSDFPEARMLKDQLLLLPVHQNLTARHMDYIAEVIRSLSAHQGKYTQNQSAAIGLIANHDAA